MLFFRGIGENLFESGGAPFMFLLDHLLLRKKVTNIEKFIDMISIEKLFE
jgi:hypothetical protein